MGKGGLARYSQCILKGFIDKLGSNSILPFPCTNDVYHFFDGLKDITDYNAGNNLLGSIYNNYDLILLKTICGLAAKIKPINEKIKNGHKGSFIVNNKFKRELIRSISNLIELFFRKNTIINNALKSVNICHVPYNFNIPSNFYKYKKVIKSITIHDLIPVLYGSVYYSGQLTRQQKIDALKWEKGIKSLSNQEIVFTVSEYTKNDLCNFNKNINPENVHVTHLAAEKTFKPILDTDLIENTKANYKIPTNGQYLLSTFANQPRKNMLFVVKCFLDLIKTEKIRDLYLVLSGGGINGSFSTFNDSPSSLKEIILDKQNKIILTGSLEDEEMAILHSGAMCFCFPSLVEGFGIPVLEAMQCGSPVITSNVTSLPEVAGDAAILIDPCDEDSFKQAILDLYKNSSLRKEMSEKGKQRAQLFSWDKCVDQMIEVYSKAMK